MPRAHALQVGIDPGIRELDQLEAGRLADAAFDHALADLAEQAPGAVELIASYGQWELRAAIESLYSELRSRGELRPWLPLLPESEGVLLTARRELVEMASQVAAELGAIRGPSVRVTAALERLGRLDAVLGADAPWPGELE